MAEAEVGEIQRDLEAPLGQGYIIGEVNQTAPVPSFGAAQPAVQPLPPGQPILSAEPIVAEPILPAEPGLPAEPVVVQPALPAEPILLDEPLFFEEEPPFVEETPVSEGTFSREARAAAPEQKTVVAESAGGGAVAVAGSVSASAHSS